jgi:hypothetical protein
MIDIMYIKKHGENHSKSLPLCFSVIANLNKKS